MKQLKIRILLIVIFLISTVFILALNLSAQEREKERGYQGPISKERMRLIFSSYGIVKGYVINGEDIIKIIKETDFKIEIESSIIEGGLDFLELAVPLEKENLPENWNEKKKEAFIETKSRFIEDIRVVKNRIKIINSEIKSNYGDTRDTIFCDSLEFLSSTFSGVADFEGSTFNGDAGFSGSTFSDYADFSESAFNGDADFSESAFKDYADFSVSAFKEGADFSGSTFSGVAVFEGSTFSDYAVFSGSTFSGVAVFSGSTFNGDAYFSESAFNGHAYFSESAFNGHADFSVSAFKEGADFSVSAFSDYAFFSGATFSAFADFPGATFSDYALFQESVFSGDTDFTMATFIKVAYFRGASFFSRLNAANALFKEYADFQEAKIRRLNYNSADSPTIVEARIDFRSAIITEAHFQDIIFEKDVDFSDVRFGIPIIIVKLEKLPQGLEFPDSLKDKIHYEVRAKLLTFTGVMTKSEKEELTGLSEDSQYREAIEQLFLESTLGPFAVIFRFVKFESDAYFLRTKFSGDTALESVTFKKEANFTDAEFKGKKEDGKHNFSLSYLNFKNLLIKWDQLPNPKSWVRGTRIKSFIDKEEEEDRERSKEMTRKKKGEKEVELEPLSQVLKGLEANFRNQNQLSDANNAYYFKKKAEFKEERDSKSFWKWFLRQAWKIWRLSCGYGTKILWILGWIIFIDLFFAMIYSFKNNLDKKIHPETEREFAFKQRLFDFPRLYLSEAKPLDMIKSKFAIKFINALRFSSVILFKVGYRDTTISGKILGIEYKYIVWIEWLLGFYLLACLTVTMSNTIPIINSLIKGIF